MGIYTRVMRDPIACKQVIDIYLADDKPTVTEAARRAGINFHTTSAILQRDLTAEHYQYEKALRYSRSKTGPKNPMLGKTGKMHHNYKGEISDGKGYLIILKPDWYTGRKGTKHVYLHHAVMCEKLGITEIPKGFHVHHIDKDPINNEIGNLALATVKGHSRLHHIPSKKFTLWEKKMSGILK